MQFYFYLITKYKRRLNRKGVEKMEKLSMCRVCLGEDIRLHSIVETHLQEMYESLVLVPFETKDSRPILACYICRARLQNCYELRRSCLQSEELFTQILRCEEVGPVILPDIFDNKKRLTMHRVAHFRVGHVPQLSVDNDSVEALTSDDVKMEQSDPEDIDEDALEEYSIYDNIQSADSDDTSLVVVKEEQPRYKTADRRSDITSKIPNEAAQNNPEDLTSSNLQEHQLVQDMSKELHKVTAADKIGAKNINEVTFTLNDNNKERTTSVPHSERVQYTCDTCRQCYSSKCKLERHIRLCSDVWKRDLSRENSTSSHTHTSQRPHQCCVCEKSFSFLSVLTSHMRTHTGEKPYYCVICKKQFSLKGNLSNHIRTHTGEKPYHCDICKKQFTLNCNLNKHIRTHIGEKPYHCVICKKQFSLKCNLRDHIRTHTGEKPYHCNICKRQFSIKKTLTSHMRTHTGEKPYQCTMCKKSFSLKHNLNRHFLMHTGEKPYYCDICKKQFSLKCNLRDHIRTHTGEKPFHCNICKRQFSQKKNFTIHMRTHTGEKPYHCNICKKQFAQKQNFTNHMRTHTGEKPYHCDICKKQFTLKKSLTNHLRTHAGERRYQCNQCQKYFLTKDILKIHFITHTGEKPYQCNICKKYFTESCNLTRHIRTHW